METYGSKPSKISFDKDFWSDDMLGHLQKEEAVQGEFYKMDDQCFERNQDKLKKKSTVIQSGDLKIIRISPVVYILFTSKPDRT